MKKSKLEIIDEAIERIKLLGRSIGKLESPFYFNHNGLRCSVGIAMNPEKFNKKYEHLSVMGIEKRCSMGFDELLLDDYKGHPSMFWQELQCLHDLSFYWDSSDETPGGVDLSYTGKSRVVRLKENYKEEENNQPVAEVFCEA